MYSEDTRQRMNAEINAKRAAERALIEAALEWEKKPDSNYAWPANQALREAVRAYRAINRNPS